jgi:hypothetical protein
MREQHRNHAGRTGCPRASPQRGDCFERDTHGGGFVARESADGRTQLYIPKALDSPLLAQPLSGGAPRPIIACVAGTAFSIGPAGIYYVPVSCRPTPDPSPPVHVMNSTTGADREVGRLETFWYDSFRQVSPCHPTAEPPCTAGSSEMKPTS